MLYSYKLISMVLLRFNIKTTQLVSFHLQRVFAINYNFRPCLLMRQLITIKFGMVSSSGSTHTLTTEALKCVQFVCVCKWQEGRWQIKQLLGPNNAIKRIFFFSVCLEKKVLIHKSIINAGVLNGSADRHSRICTYKKNTKVANNGHCTLIHGQLNNETKSCALLREYIRG